MVRRPGTMVNIETLTHCLFREISESKVLADELKNFKKLPCDVWDYDELCAIITSKVADIDLQTRTKAQLAEHDKHMNGFNTKPARKGGGGGGSKGGGGKQAALTPGLAPVL